MLHHNFVSGIDSFISTLPKLNAFIDRVADAILPKAVAKGCHGAYFLCETTCEGPWCNHYCQNQKQYCVYWEIQYYKLTPGGSCSHQCSDGCDCLVSQGTGSCPGNFSMSSRCNDY